MAMMMYRNPKPEGGEDMAKDTTLSKKQKEVARCIAEGMTVQQAFQATMITPGRIMTWLEDPEMMREVDRVQQLNEKIVYGASLNVLNDLRNSESEKTRMQAVKTAVAIKNRQDDIENSDTNISVMLPVIPQLPDSADDTYDTEGDDAD